MQQVRAPSGHILLRKRGDWQEEEDSESNPEDLYRPSFVYKLLEV
jgi:hypothetical protein